MNVLLSFTLCKAFAVWQKIHKMISTEVQSSLQQAVAYARKRGIFSSVVCYGRMGLSVRLPT